MKTLDNKVAIVTGAGSGIGREIALLYAKNGARVVVSDVSEDAGQKVTEEITNNKGEAQFIKADSSSPTEMEELVRQTVEFYGKLDIACNNAGIGGSLAPTGEYSLEDWDKVISINLTGVFYGMRFQIPALIGNGGGCIVNIASILGSVGSRNSPAYIAAKHGVVGLTKAAALDHAEQSIRINAIGPGYIRTPLLTDNLSQSEMEALVDLHPIGRLGEAAEVAEMALWLSSEKSSFVTGSYYPVEGGYLAQ